MNNFYLGNGVFVENNKVTINGVEVPPCPSGGNNLTVINNKVFIDGYELINGQWKRTLKGLWHLLF